MPPKFLEIYMPQTPAERQAKYRAVRRVERDILIARAALADRRYETSAADTVVKIISARLHEQVSAGGNFVHLQTRAASTPAVLAGSDLSTFSIPDVLDQRF
jgi:hypothetical protein